LETHEGTTMVTPGQLKWITVRNDVSGLSLW